MLPLERKQEIIKIIKQDKSVRVTQLSEKYNVTEETIRRDLEKLEKEGILTRTYGGAVIDEHVSDDPTFVVRSKENIDNKRKIAKYASQLIKDGDTVFLDPSTTALQVAKSIKEDKSVTIITNSVNAVKTLSKNKKFNIIGIGGTLNTRTLSFEGPIASRFINNYYADKVIFSCKGISKEKGIMDSHEETVEIKNRMIDNAKQTILVVDESKFDRKALIKVIDFAKVDIIVTDYKLDDEWLEILEKDNIQIISGEEAGVSI